jgi:putative transposase
MIEGHRVILRETDQSHSSKGTNAMTTAHNIDLPAVLADRLTTCHPDVLRQLLATFIHTLMGAEADALCGAGYGERSAERINSRNGYRHGQFDTRTGTLDLAIPKLRHGSYFPDWLLERRKRAERALTTVVATCYLLGVSTRRMDKLVETLGSTGLSNRTNPKSCRGTLGSTAEMPGMPRRLSFDVVEGSGRIYGQLYGWRARQRAVRGE